MHNLQSSIAQVTSTVEAALKRQATDGLLPNVIDALQAVEIKVMSSRNVLRKRLDGSDVKISELSANISALKEDLTTQGGKLDQAMTILESKQEANTVSWLKEQVSAQGIKLDTAVGIIEAQHDMIKTLLGNMQKESSERKADLERVHSHFNAVVERIAFLDRNGVSQDVPSVTSRDIGHNESRQPPTNFTPANPPLDADVLMSEPHSLPDRTPSVTPLNLFSTPSTPRNNSTNLMDNGVNIPSSDATAVIVAGTSAITIVDRFSSADHTTATVNVAEQTSSADSSAPVKAALAETSSPDVIVNTIAISANDGKDSLADASTESAPRTTGSNIKLSAGEDVSLSSAGDSTQPAVDEEPMSVVS